VPSSGADDSAGATTPALTLLTDVRWHGAPVTGERTHALLASLASTLDEGVSEGRLIGDIWGADEPANPTKALQVVVSRARSATSADAVVRTPHGYRLGTHDTDVARVARACDEARRAESAGDWPAAVAAAAPVLAIAVEDDEDGELGRLGRCRPPRVP
jgi:DNA-binding SARP family transcriptional activator